MDHELRTFTIEEANQLLPALTKSLAELKTLHNAVVSLEAQIDAHEIIANGDPGQISKDLNRLVESHHIKVTEFYSLVDQIHQQGCLLKDVEQGLIDFYAVLNGKVVYLCWKMGEEKVSHWHEVGKGYSSREPIQ